MNAEKFPETLHEATLYFANGDNALKFMADLRWPDGKATCPRCGSQIATFMASRQVWNCNGCKKQFSVKVGTVFEDSPIKLNKWLCALWLLANAKNGISSYEVHRALGVTQKTAWFMLHRLRLALHEGTVEKMTGRVEADETFIGADARKMNKKQRARREAIHGKGLTGTFARTAVQGLLERGTREKVSRVKVKVTKGITKQHLQGHVRDYVLKGSEVLTDAAPAYVGLASDFDHKVVDHAICYAKGHVHTNGLENFWSLLKRTIRGTYIAPAPYHLFRYLDEQAFRFNERKDDDQGRFLTAIQGIVGKRLLYGNLIGAGQSLPA